MVKGYSMQKAKEGELLPQIKGMLFLSFMGHIILFVLVIYLSLKFNQYRVNPPVYNVNLVDFIGDKGGPKAAIQKVVPKNTTKEPVKKISPLPVVKEKPKEIKKPEPEKPKKAEKPKEPDKPKLPKEEPKKVEKPPLTVAQKKEPQKSQKEGEPSNTQSQGAITNPSPVIASRGNGVNLAGGYRGSLSLDNVNFPFVYYLVLIRDKISEKWNPDFGPVPSVEGQQVVIAFKIQKDGIILEPYIEKSSGIAYLDQSALRAVLSSVPFPPLPREFGENSLGIHFGFEYIREG